VAATKRERAATASQQGGPERLSFLGDAKWSLFLGADKGHHAQQNGRLALGFAAVLLEERLVGPVVAELKPA
jgi:hypothetical protein